jgi:hypothetical protein
LEQVKYPRDLPLAVLMAYSDTGDAVDLTSQCSRRAAGLIAPGRWTLYALSPAGTGSWSSAPRPGARVRHRPFSTDATDALLPFDRAFAGHRSAAFARFSTTLMKSMTRPAKPLTPRFFANSSNAAATISAGIFRRSSAAVTAT